MRRLMTGYAVTFNKRHKRIGHLFQNRYKSIACEEDPYLLELIRYIHLNPLRAGHNVILGRCKNPLIPNAAKRNTPFAGGGLVFTLSSGKGERQENPVNPVNPVESDKFLAEKAICLRRSPKRSAKGGLAFEGLHSSAPWVT